MVKDTALNYRSNRKNKEAHKSCNMGKKPTQANKKGSECHLKLCQPTCILVFFSLRNGCMNSGLTEFQGKKCSAWGIWVILILQVF